MKILSKSRRADSTNFGFDFQTNAAIVLMLENIEELNSLRIEGNYEDIEVELNNGNYILAQAKAVVKSSTDFSNVRSNLKKAIKTLSEAATKTNVQNLIFITNSLNPFNDDNSRNIFYGNTRRKYSTLPESSQKIIDKYLNELSVPFDKDKFIIQVVPFETDDDRERYKIIKECIGEFIGKLNINTVYGISDKLLEIWQNDISHNASKKDSYIKLSKKDIVWPLLVIITDITRCDINFIEQFDASLYEEITHTYSSLINSCCEQFEFFTKVLYDFQEFKSMKKPLEKCNEFALTQWENYLDDLTISTNNEEVQKGLIQIILYKIIKNRFNIDNIKNGVNL